MARIELRYCSIFMKDGLAGTAAINQSMTAPVTGDATMTIDTVVLNTDITTQVPIGARFTVAGESDATQVHVVTGRTGPDPTTAITFSPALGAGTYLDDGVITFTAQELNIKIGDGDLKYTENLSYVYDLDRGILDDVRLGDDAPMDLSLDFVYEHITTGTAETISPMDALKQIGGASGWLSSATDQCQPYSVDLLIIYTPPCGTSQIETTLFPDVRADKREVSFKDSKISLTAKCFAIEPIVTRGT